MFKYGTEDEDDIAISQATNGQVGRLVVANYTYILIGSIIAVAIAQFAVGLELSVDRAGFVKPAFINDHEYWRILTGATEHGGLMHVFMNCYALYNFGRIFESLSNRAHLAIVFLLSVVGGGILSLIFVPDGTSVGASGGIVGLIGYLAVYTFRRREFISPAFRKDLLVNIGFILIFGLILFQVVDNFGHIGGLLTGTAYGFLQISGDPYVDPREAGSGAALAGVTALSVYIASCVLSVFLILRVV